MREAIRAHQYSRRTEEAYVFWVRRYVVFHGKRHPSGLGSPEVTAFLSDLAVRGQVSPSTQNQALSALLFLYRKVLRQDLADLDQVVRAKRSVRVPLVLSRDEVSALLRSMHGVPGLMAGLMYGSGLRLLECARLRVKDLDFARNQVTVHDGKGRKDRVTLLPPPLVEPLRRHVRRIEVQHAQDVKAGQGTVDLPGSLRRKYPSAESEWAWQWVFPATRFYTCRRTGLRRGITSTSRPSNEPSRTRSAVPASPSQPAATRCGIRSRPISSNPATTSGRSRSCLGTTTSAPR